MADELKSFRVILRDGKSFIVRAHHYDSRHHLFYKNEKDVDQDIWVRDSEIVAVIPDVPARVQGTSSSSGMR